MIFDGSVDYFTVNVSDANVNNYESSSVSLSLLISTINAGQFASKSFGFILFLSRFGKLIGVLPKIKVVAAAIILGSIVKITVKHGSTSIS